MTGKTKHESDPKRHEWALNERIKELTCLHELGRVLAQEGASIEAILRDAVMLLPPAWQFPNDTAARITHGESCFPAGNFPKTEPSLSSPLSVDGIQVGTVEVAYRHEHPAADEGPFLKEERALLDTFTQRLGHHVKQIQAQEEVRAANQQLQATEQQLRAANQQLEAGNQQLETMCNAIDAGIALIDAKTRVIQRVNSTLLEIGGYSENELVGRVCHDVICTACQDKCPIADLNQDLDRSERMLVHKDGHKVQVQRTVTPITLQGREVYVETVVDISERTQLENRLRQSERLESVGQLAGGVAHDFNNLLMGIMNYAELCRERLETDHPIQQWIGEIARGAERSAGIVEQLLAFSRKQIIEPKVLDLNDAVESMLKMLRRLIGEDIDAMWKPGANLHTIKIDPGQVDQIVANLCVNARDAIGGAGKITIETANVTLDADYCAAHAEAIPGDYVMLAVSDDGCGMDEATQAEIFEPFFTTKPKDKGTGLGLATVYGIVKQNGGSINVYSEPGNGTTFRIYLQRCDEAVEQEEQANAPDVAADGNETILLVEDERSIRVTTRLFLEAAGYTVVAAESPAEALQLVDESEVPLDLMITDVVMPGMTGRELAEQLHAAHAGLKVLYMSGYTADVIAHRGILDDGVDFMSKPITRHMLLGKVREVLDCH